MNSLASVSGGPGRGINRGRHFSANKYSVCWAGGVVCLTDQSRKCSIFSVIGPESDTLVAGFQPCSELSRDVVFTEPGRPWAGGRVLTDQSQPGLNKPKLRKSRSSS